MFSSFAKNGLNHKLTIKLEPHYITKQAAMHNQLRDSLVSLTTLNSTWRVLVFLSSHCAWQFWGSEDRFHTGIL